MSNLGRAFVEFGSPGLFWATKANTGKRLIERGCISLVCVSPVTVLDRGELLTVLHRRRVRQWADERVQVSYAVCFSLPVCYEKLYISAFVSSDPRFHSAGVMTCLSFVVVVSITVSHQCMLSLTHSDHHPFLHL